MNRRAEKQNRKKNHENGKIAVSLFQKEVRSLIDNSRNGLW